MSSVTFNSVDGDSVSIGGRERARFGCLTQDIATAMLDMGSGRVTFGLAEKVARWKQVMDPEHYLMKESRPDKEFEHGFGVSFGGYGDMIQWRGRKISGFSLILNTAMLLGNDVVKLMARIHGQCELHGYVEGPNRVWLADIISRGVREELLLADARSNYGSWTDVSLLLRRSSDSPIVMSYSVNESFPNLGLIKEYDKKTDPDGAEWEKSSEEFYAIPAAEQWRLCVNVLRTEEETGKFDRELRPSNFQTHRFGSGITVMDLTAHDRDERLDRKLGAK